jgi:hypothetical protein
MIDPLGPDTAELKSAAIPAREVGSLEGGMEKPAPPKTPSTRSESVQQRRPNEGHVPGRMAITKPVPRPDKPTAFERAVGVARVVLPIMGKLLPLLEGNVVTAASNLMSNRGSQSVDLEPLQAAIGELHHEQRTQQLSLAEQKNALQRIEDEVVTLKEAVDRNSQDQNELAETVLNLRRRLTRSMRLVVILLVLITAFVALLCVRIAYMLKP